MSAARECPTHGEWVDDGTTFECPECIAEEVALIERNARERPIASALPTARAERLYSRIGRALGWGDEQIADHMAARADRLDEAARRFEAGFHPDPARCVCGGSGWIPGNPEDDPCPYHAAREAS